MLQDEKTMKVVGIKNSFMALYRTIRSTEVEGRGTEGPVTDRFRKKKSAGE